MKTALFFLQDANQTQFLESLIKQAINQGYTRFLTTMLLEDNLGMVFIIESISVDEFPFDNLFRANQILLVQEPLQWLCEQGDEVFAIWDGNEDETFQCLGFLKAWGMPGTYLNPSRALVPETL